MAARDAVRDVAGRASHTPLNARGVRTRAAEEDSVMDGAAAQARTADTPYTRRARYWSVRDAFAQKHAPVPRHVFAAECERAFAETTPSGLIDMDLSAVLGAPGPATLPFVLARYVRLNPGAPLLHRLKATSETYYVIAGAGRTSNRADAIAWKEGDVFCFPGGGESRHEAETRAVLFLVTDEPQLAFLGAAPPAPGEAPTEPTHWPAEAIAAAVEDAYRELTDADPGKAVLFSGAKMDRWRTVNPLMTIAINTLEAGATQRPHRHNAAALTLPLDCEGCSSTIEGEQVAWVRHAVMVTPPGEAHAHHNRGPARMRSIVVQDGGLHYFGRTMDFAFTDDA